MPEELNILDLLAAQNNHILKMMELLSEEDRLKYLMSVNEMTEGIVGHMLSRLTSPAFVEVVLRRVFPNSTPISPTNESEIVFPFATN